MSGTREERTDVAPGEARFDESLGAWVLSSYADVVAALRERRLSASGTGIGVAERGVWLRDAVGRTLPGTGQADRRVGMARSALQLARLIPEGRTVDLVATFAGPWSRQLAVEVAGVSPSEAGGLLELARRVFLAAAHAVDRRSEPAAHAATAELAGKLSGADPTIAVQTFVALSQTLPCLLAGVWHELFLRPLHAARLRAAPDLIPLAVDELIRLASPARAVFRQAIESVTIGTAKIGAGDRVILMLAAANRDPVAFPDPLEIELSRSRSSLSFGRGTHSCQGMSVVRAAVSSATSALLDTTHVVELAGTPETLGGFAIRGPASLPVVIRRQPMPIHPEPDSEMTV